MKLTQTITDLLFNLSEVETAENTQLLIGDGKTLRNNLLKLYRATDNVESHDMIISIMSEAGYPWFGKLARSVNKIEDSNLSLVEATPKTNSGEDNLMSEDEFMELIPANGHFH